MSAFYVQCPSRPDFLFEQVRECTATETLQLLSFKPDRLGHATFLDADAKKIVHTEEMCIELCLSSNLLCKTVPTLDVHHIGYYLAHNHPIAICVSPWPEHSRE